MTPDTNPGNGSSSFSVLVVEDNDDLRELIAENLRELGHRSIAVRGSAEALAAVDEQVDVLLTDVALPDGSGIALAGAIAARFPRLPIIVSSGYGDTMRSSRIESAIKPDVLTLPKPFDIEQLRAVLERAKAQLRR
jgi:DNA-binding NtrC family response regulator